MSRKQAGGVIWWYVSKVKLPRGGGAELLDLRFRETQKTSVGRLITATKLSEVARKLRETRLSIATVQETCGFKNANALKNLFKRHFGMTMRDYRDSYKWQFLRYLPPSPSAP